VFDNTLIYYIVGDNGASAEGTLNGTFNEMINFNGAAALETPEFMLERLDQFGGPDSYSHYAVGWAHAMDTRTNGPSRLPRTSEGRATARSCTGPAASTRRMRSGRSSRT
jgi:hypothetical protein